MIRGSIQIQADTLQDVVDRLTVLAREIEGSCKLDEDHGEHTINDSYQGTILRAWFQMIDPEMLPTIEELSGSIDFGGRVQF